MQGQQQESMREMRAYRARTYTATVVPPTMLLVAAGLLFALAANWLRDRPHLGYITLSTIITVALILALSPIVRSVAQSGRSSLTGVLGLIYVLVLSTHLNLVAHFNGNGIQQSMALCVIISVSSTFFWVWEWQLVVGLLFTMGPPVVLLFADNYSRNTQYIQLQTALVTVLVCVACYFYLRHTNMASYLLMKEVEYRASFDALTGLLNRAEWFTRAGRALDTTEHGALLFVDLDRFKVLNDRDGHVAGDQMLKRISAILQEGSATSDIIGRFGGDEFVLFLPGGTSEDAAERAARIHAILEAAQDITREITASIGIASREAEDTLDTLVHRADSAMFAIKPRGRVVA